VPDCVELSLGKELLIAFSSVVERCRRAATMENAGRRSEAIKSNASRIARGSSKPRPPYSQVSELLRKATEDLAHIRDAFRRATKLFNDSRSKSRCIHLTIIPGNFDPRRHRFTYLGLPIPNPSRRLGGSPDQDEYLEVVLKVSSEYRLQLKDFKSLMEDARARIIAYRVRDPHTRYRTFIFIAAPGFRKGVEDYVREHNPEFEKENGRIILVDLGEKNLRQAVLETLVTGVDRGEDGKPLKPFLSWRVHRYLTQGDFEKSDGKVFGSGKDFVDIMMLLVAFLRMLNGDRAVEEAVDRLKIAVNMSEYEVEGYRAILRTLVGDLDMLGVRKPPTSTPNAGNAVKPAAGTEKPRIPEDFLLAQPDDPSRWEVVEDSEEVAEE